MSSRPASVVAIIPARAGSKGVPGKNLRDVAGRSLIARAVGAARHAKTIDRVIVSTDGADIAAAAREAGADVIIRPDELASDTATSEVALMHAIGQLDPAPDVVVFIQATSPFIDPNDLDDAVRRVRDGHEDVVFSAIETYSFIWRKTDVGAVGVNHDAATRPRRQEREPHFQETGAFYVMKAAGFLAAGHRFFGRVGVVEVDYARAVEIDTDRELQLASMMAPLFDGPRAIDPSAINPAASDPPAIDPSTIDVDALVTDFDGVHTDDRVRIDQDGRESVTVSRSDGAGVAALRTAGITVLILSKETNSVVSARARKLQVEVLQGIDDKATAITEWARGNAIPLERIAYVGNDLNDLGAMGLVGWPIAVADARPEVSAAARTVLAAKGGHGAVREAADRILDARTENFFNVELLRESAHSDPVLAAHGPTANGTAAHRNYVRTTTHQEES